MSIEQILGEHKDKRNELIAVLQKIQNEEGFVSKDSIRKVAVGLKIPTSMIYGVLTFYSFFKLEKSAKYQIFVCEGTACHVRGAPDLIKELEKVLGIKAGDMTKDMKFSIEIVRCLGMCASAPLIKINEEVYPKIGPSDIQGIVDLYKDK